MLYFVGLKVDFNVLPEILSVLLQKLDDTFHISTNGNKMGAIPGGIKYKRYSGQ